MEKDGIIMQQKNISIIKGIVSKHHGDFYFLIFFHSITTENKRESHKKLCESNDFCNVVMPFEDTKILDFDQYQNLIKQHLLFMQILNVLQKILMDARIIPKIHSH